MPSITEMVNKIRGIFIRVLVESNEMHAMAKFKYFSNHFRSCRLVDQYPEEKTHQLFWDTHTHCAHISAQTHLVMLLEE